MILFLIVSCLEINTKTDLCQSHAAGCGVSPERLGPVVDVLQAKLPMGKVVGIRLCRCLW